MAKIIAVSKKQSCEKIRQAVHLGLRDFGENYFQEVKQKSQELSDLQDEIRWHFIGRLQKNKISGLVGLVDCIHSVDSSEALRKIDRVASERGLCQKVLLQIRLGEEDSKGGFDWQKLLQEWSELGELKSVSVCGLMTLPPLGDTPEESRVYFRELANQLKQLRTLADLDRHPLTELSMGTSFDYTVALEEGATMIRVGTALFGERIQ